MIALSFLQPWSFAVIHLGKTLDNRRQKNGKRPPMCKYRGPLLIHASGGPGPTMGSRAEGERVHRVSYYDWSVDWMVERNLWREPKPGEMPRGGIVGRCRVIGECAPDGSTVMDVGGSPDMRWHMPGSYGLLLADVEPLQFVPWKGALGLWKIPDNYAELAQGEQR